MISRDDPIYLTRYRGTHSTVGAEKRRNPFMCFASLHEFLSVMGGRVAS